MYLVFGNKIVQICTSISCKIKVLVGKKQNSLKKSKRYEVANFLSS